MAKEYHSVEKKLKNREYKVFTDFERDLKFLQAHFLENGPNGPNKRLVVFEFVQKALTLYVSLIPENWEDFIY